MHGSSNCRIAKLASPHEHIANWLLFISSRAAAEGINSDTYRKTRSFPSKTKLGSPVADRLACCGFLECMETSLSISTFSIKSPQFTSSNDKCHMRRQSIPDKAVWQPETSIQTFISKPRNEVLTIPKEKYDLFPPNDKPTNTMVFFPFSSCNGMAKLEYDLARKRCALNSR